jgi:dipeptidyl aminopeptidase/acylaminoacyl peptidase
VTPAGTHELVRALINARTSVVADVEPRATASERVLVLRNLVGTMQLYELSGDAIVALTELPEPVGTARYVPGARLAVLGIDAGGNERRQLYLLDLDAAGRAPVRDLAELTPLTDAPRFVHYVAGISPDGELIAYLSNRENGVDFDLWTCDLAGGQARLRWASGAWCQPGSGFSPGGRWLSLIRPGARPLDDDLVLVDLNRGASATPLPHPDRAALVGAPAWLGEERFLAASNAGGDMLAIQLHDLAGDRTVPIPGSEPPVDCDVVSSLDGRTVVLAENRDGATVMRRLDPGTGALGAALATIEPGIVAGAALTADGARLYYTLSGPRIPGDVFVCDVADGATRRLTESPCEVPPDALAEPELAWATSFDGERVPLFVYRPRDAGPAPPVVVHVHGGPESQAVRSFNPSIQALVAAGLAVVVPNVRGSTGYGKRWAALDDTVKRLDSVRDLAAVHGVLGELGFDARRAALWGGSYGGYMVLAGVAFQPELWAAGVDIVGISNLVSFLKNTAPYRRAHRELEYGSLEQDRAFLADASPLSRADEIRAPLFVIHGRNDPRVPVGEAEQIARSLRDRGVRCELVIYEDEGHGLARLRNRLDAYPRAIAFLEDVLGRR